MQSLCLLTITGPSAKLGWGRFLPPTPFLAIEIRQVQDKTRPPLAEDRGRQAPLGPPLWEYEHALRVHPAHVSFQLSFGHVEVTQCAIVIDSRLG